MANLIVTGGAGFIGANFVRYWRQRYPTDGIVPDLLTYAGNLANLNDVVDLDFVEGDILDEELVTQLMREQAIDTLVHFAAEKPC